MSKLKILKDNTIVVSVDLQRYLFWNCLPTNPHIEIARISPEIKLTKKKSNLLSIS